MAVEVKLSSLGVNITEGTIVRWLKKEGDAVEKGEILAEVETETTFPLIRLKNLKKKRR
jgi:pyruvate/2-oxoglutarate dehydrogenase complex dihydrolipoamide acyltransferase (E2) component